MSGLDQLREFSLKAKTSAFGDDIVAFAGVLAEHPTLAVLELSVPKAFARAVLHQGFPANLKVLGMGSCDDFDGLLLVLPSGLVALRLAPGICCSAANFRALLLHCPQLRALSVVCGDEAVGYLASGDVDRPLLLDRNSLPAVTDEDALTAVGHRVEVPCVGVDWRIAGGVVCNGKGAGI